jgi:tripartite-type tricarboxylate transporter receptor subunit TctC
MRIFRALSLATLLALGADTAAAQMYPVKPVKIIVSTSPGGVTDLAARILGQHITSKTGQTVVIDNRAGASGNIAMDAVAKAEPDGYTLGVANTGNIVINPYLFPAMPYDPLKDLTPVGLLGTVPLFLVMNSNVPVTSLSEFIAYAKANPDKLNFATPGVGTPPHVAGELFKMTTGVNFVHVPYRGTGPMLTDLIAGHVQVAFDPLPASIEYIRAGKLRALGVTTAKRSEALPDIPSVGEHVSGYAASNWYGFAAPTRTPAEIVSRLNSEINAALTDPKIKARFIELGGTPLASSPGDFAKLVTDDTEKWAKVIRAANIKPD